MTSPRALLSPARLVALAAVAAGLALPAAASAQAPPPLRIVTANIPFPVKDDARVKNQIEKVAFKSGASVIVLQEMRERDVQALFDDVWRRRGSNPDESFRVLKAKTDSNALAFRRTRFDFKGGGTLPAFPSGGGQPGRSFVFATLFDKLTNQTITPLGLHYPTNARSDATNRAQYYRMNANFKDVVQRFKARGLFPIAGGDHNASLDRVESPWSPLKLNRSLGRTTNWLPKAPCSGGTSAGGGHIDGFSFDRTVTSIVGQGCLGRGVSDHKPVFIDVTSSAPAFTAPAG